MIEGVYSGEWYMKKGGGLKKCEKVSGRLWGKNRSGNKKTGETG